MSSEEFNTAVVRLYDTIKPYAVSLTKNMIDAEDLIRDTMTRAFRYKDNFKHNTNLKSWLLVIMKNIFINQYRQKATRKYTLVDPVEQLYQMNVSHTTFNSGDSDLTIEDINHAIARLPKAYQTTLMMNVQGYQYQEIADALNVPLGTIKSRIFWIRKRLAEELRPYINRTGKKVEYSLN